MVTDNQIQYMHHIQHICICTYTERERELTKGKRSAPASENLNGFRSADSSPNACSCTRTIERSGLPIYVTTEPDRTLVQKKCSATVQVLIWPLTIRPVSLKCSRNMAHFQVFFQKHNSDSPHYIPFFRLLLASTCCRCP